MKRPRFKWTMVVTAILAMIIGVTFSVVTKGWPLGPTLAALAVSLVAFAGAVIVPIVIQDRREQARLWRQRRP